MGTPDSYIPLRGTVRSRSGQTAGLPLKGNLALGLGGKEVFYEKRICTDR
jgi:hypothetical protein